MAWKHRFVCLSAVNQPNIPTSTKHKEELKFAELHSSAILLKRRVKNSRTYIRPIQRNLDLASVVMPELKQMCFGYLKNIPLSVLKDHISKCDGKHEEQHDTEEKGEDSGEDSGED